MVNWDRRLLDDVLDELQAIREAIGGIRPVIRTEGGRDFTMPKNALVIANQRWEDEDVEALDFTTTTLEPGEEATIVEVVSTEPNVKYAARSVATSAHAGDYNDDNVDESLVRYRFEHKKEANDKWHTLPGLTSTVPYGQIGQPVELMPGTFVGPVSGFRIVFENVTEGESNPINVDGKYLAAQLHGRILR